MKLRILTGLSILIILLLTIVDLKPFQYGFECIDSLINDNGIEKIAIRLCIGNLLFKIFGITLAILALKDLIKKIDKPTKGIKLLWVYTLIAIILTLPIYHRHTGIGGPQKHGHSFWNGGLHLH